jgi:hypothetical protein
MAQVWTACVGASRQGVVARGLDARVSARSVASHARDPGSTPRVRVGLRAQLLGIDGRIPSRPPGLRA